jgi:hypothetical protein
MLLDDTTLDVLKRCSQSLQAVRRKDSEREEASTAATDAHLRESAERKPATKS